MATIWTWTSQVAEAAGLGHVQTHRLRHTSLTTALDNTKDLRSVMEFARHSRPQTTAGYTRTTKAAGGVEGPRLLGGDCGESDERWLSLSADTGNTHAVAGFSGGSLGRTRTSEPRIGDPGLGGN